MVGCLAPLPKKEVATRAKSDEVVKLSIAHAKKIQDSSSFNIGKVQSRLAFSSLLENTSWKLQSRPTMKQIKTIFAVALEESKDSVLEARAASLSSEGTMELRFDLWLNSNLWLEWNRNMVSGTVKPFVYWDLCEDQVPQPQGTYGKETEEAVSKAMFEDALLLKHLGDMLTTHPSLTNNKDEPRNERVISIEAKATIDEVLTVS